MRRRPPPWLLVLSVASLHFATAVLAVVADLPFRLESWATIAGTIVGGFAVGATGALLSRLALVLAIGDDPIWLGGGATLVTAALAAVLWRRGWLDIERPLRLVAAGLAMGAAAGAVALAAHAVGVEALPARASTLLFRARLADALAIDGGALHLERLLLDLVDKVIAVIVAAGAITLLEERSGVVAGPASPAAPDPRGS